MVAWVGLPLRGSMTSALIIFKEISLRIFCNNTSLGLDSRMSGYRLYRSTSVIRF